MKEYLEKSGRTAAAPELGRDVYKTDTDILIPVVSGIVRSGAVADCTKRSLFYHDTKISRRMEETDQRVSKLEVQLDQQETADNLKLEGNEIDIVHAILGLASETGEIAEEIADAKLKDRPIDIENLKEEAGDLLWYIALLLRSIGSDFETVAAMNLAKLAKRYPEKFETEQALTRDLEAEKDALASKKAD